MTAAYGDVPLLDPETGRFPDSFAPLSVEARVTGGNLAAALAGLPAYTPGQPLRKLTVKPGTYTLATTLTIPSGVHIDARGAKFISALAGTSGRLVTISGVTDVEIEGGTWDGDKASFAEATEWRHNFFIIGAGRVRLHGLASINAKARERAEAYAAAQHEKNNLSTTTKEM